MALKTSVKELKAKEISKVEEISWNISNRIREFGNASMYGGFCLAYVAYVSLKNKITDINQRKYWKFMECCNRNFRRIFRSCTFSDCFMVAITGESFHGRM